MLTIRLNYIKSLKINKDVDSFYFSNYDPRCYTVKLGHNRECQFKKKLYIEERLTNLLF